ncbi:MAG: hypothetical protein HC880_00345 [Bacteroidia bacterium]|nr:hypothetical protein [Bacteroidia bacterium]
MPHLNITSSEKGDNKGSCRALVYYLEKENYQDEKQRQLKPLAERELFFSHHQDQVLPHQVISHIDGNKKNLGKAQEKFSLVNISPSQEELQHIGNDRQKLKDYTRQVMDLYAANFGKGLKSQDLVWYAKLEENRSYKHTDRAVQLGEKQKGEPKEGLQTHVQVIVSRKCAENRLKLSPNSNHRSTQKGPVKGGFDRVNFKMKSIEKFDAMFQFPRLVNELERHQVMKYGTEGEKEAYREKQEKKGKALASAKPIKIASKESKISQRPG